MAKTSKVAKNEQRKVIVTKHAARRTELKGIINNKKSTPQEIEEASKALRKLPRDASPTRVVNRCFLTGRSHAYLRKFGLCRIAFRELALKGQIPGVTKSSW